MHILNQYFDNIYILYISQNELCNVQPKILKENIIVEYFKGVNGKKEYNKKNLTPGSYGHLLSFINILKDAITKNYNKILIFEPDIYFCDNFSEECKKYLSFEYKLLYLGASQYKFYNEYTWDNISPTFFYNAFKTLGTFAIGIDYSIFSECIKLLSNFDRPTDVCLTDIQNKYMNKCIVTYPNLICCNITSSSTGASFGCQMDAIKNFKWNLKYKIYDDFNFYTSVSAYYELILHVDSFDNNFEILLTNKNTNIFPMINLSNLNNFVDNNKIYVYILSQSNILHISTKYMYISNITCTKTDQKFIRTKTQYIKSKKMDKNNIYYKYF